MLGYDDPYKDQHCMQLRLPAACSHVTTSRDRLRSCQPQSVSAQALPYANLAQ